MQSHVPVQPGPAVAEAHRVCRAHAGAHNPETPLRHTASHSTGCSCTRHIAALRRMSGDALSAHYAAADKSHAHSSPQLLADEANQGYSFELNSFDTVQAVNGTPPHSNSPVLFFWGADRCRDSASDDPCLHSPA